MGSTPVIQTSFNAGEWAPALNARVDIQKYHSGAALLRNFIVDYRGGATTRPGSRYILPTMLSTAARLIPFQASFSVTYILEFGNNYIRFFNNGAPVLESGKTISGATSHNPGVITATGHGYSNGDWIYISGVGGMTQLNGNYYIVAGVTTNTFTLTDLLGNPINTTSFGTYTSGGAAQRIYTIVSPYLSTELSHIKFAQNVNTLVLCHPNHPPYQLVLSSATSWSMTAITFGSSISGTPSVTVTSTLAAGTVNYGYAVTAVDSNGQESAPQFGFISSLQDIRATAGTNVITWVAVAGAVAYNVYKAEPSYVALPSGTQYGYIGTGTGTQLIDSNIAQDFAQGPPVAQSPFSGSGVQTLTLTSGGSGYTAVPTVSFSGGSPTAGASAHCNGITQSSTMTSGGTGQAYLVGETIADNSNGTGFTIKVLAVTDLGSGAGPITNYTVIQQGIINAGTSLPLTITMAIGTGYPFTSPATFTLNSCGVNQLFLDSGGAGYGSTPTVNFSGPGGSGAAATATLGASGAGNPTVPGFFQQRLVLAGLVNSPQQFNMSQPGSYYNFNTNNPVEADDAIQATLVSGQLNTIQSMVTQPQGLIMFADKQAWLINGGSPGSAISAIQLVANVQAYNGSAIPPPIVANDNVLYVQAKGSIIRDLVFNFYTQVYTGADISVLSSHLFYGYSVKEWAWAEEPFKVIWAVRNDGTMLNLTFLKEQELVAWTHSDTQGVYSSVATVTETTVSSGNVDAVYSIVQRVINGNVVNYIERFAEQNYTGNLSAAWCVDAGISYSGTGALSFTGAQHLNGAIVTGIATDNLGNTTAITPFTMPIGGAFSLPPPMGGATNYTYVLVGLAFTPQLQTLALDVGEPTVQGKRKKITAVTVRCKDALGLSIGGSASTIVPMKDLVVGNVGTMTNGVVTNLVTGDARTIIDPNWTVPGQYFIQQSYPYPASILGVIPEITVGDTQK